MALRHILDDTKKNENKIKHFNRMSASIVIDWRFSAQHFYNAFIIWLWSMNKVVGWCFNRWTNLICQ